jgi:hypothetical protein
MGETFIVLHLTCLCTLFCKMLMPYEVHCLHSHHSMHQKAMEKPQTQPSNFNCWGPQERDKGMYCYRLSTISSKCQNRKKTLIYKEIKKQSNFTHFSHGDTSSEWQPADAVPHHKLPLLRQNKNESLQISTVSFKTPQYSNAQLLFQLYHSHNIKKPMTTNVRKLHVPNSLKSKP